MVWVCIINLYISILYMIYLGVLPKGNLHCALPGREEDYPRSRTAGNNEGDVHSSLGGSSHLVSS